MKTSTEIYSAAKIVGEERAVELIAKAGFDAWDFSMFDMCDYDRKKGKFKENSHPLFSSDYISFARKLKKIGLDNGIVCNQSHAPFPSKKEIFPYLIRSLECTAEAGGEICVIHPDNNLSPEENAEMYFYLLPYAKQFGVKIATENMWNWSKLKRHSTFAACATPESFLSHLKAVDDEYFVACLDIGHAEMKGSDTSAVEMIKKLGPYLKALHIHDNDKLNDSHQIPFSMKVDFFAVAKALREIGYDGYLTLEADSFLSKHTVDNVLNGLKELCLSVKRIGEEMEKQ